MNSVQFNDQLSTLERFFGKSLNLDQRAIWKSKLIHWSESKFARVINHAIEEQERFPALAVILKSGRDIPDEQVPQREKSVCNLCQGDGVVTAKKDGYNTTFRCSECQNWQGRYSESIPLYSQKYYRDGYKVDDYQIGGDRMDPNDELQLKGMKLLLEAAPGLAKKILAKHPQFLSKLEEVKLGRHLSDLKPKADKEAMRQRLLKQDHERDVMDANYYPHRSRTH